jgi:hypothetical protein
MYMLDVATDVVSTMPCARMSSDSVISPALTCTAWSKASDEIPDAS